MDFTKYMQTSNDINYFDLIDTIAIIEECHRVDELNEGVTDKVVSMTKAIKGMVKSKASPAVKDNVSIEKGLIHYIKDIGINGTKLIYYAFDVFYNKNQQSRERMRELATGVKKEQIIDIILKLDILTLHLFTGPIHIIEAVMGWDLMHGVKQKLEPAEKRVKHAIHSLENLKNDLDGKMKEQLIRYTNALRRVFNIGDFSKIKESTVGADIATPDMKIGCKGKKRKMSNKMKKKLRRVLDDDEV